MSRLKSILHEIVGLFVDDGTFALALVVWLGLVVFALAHFLSRTHWLGIVFFAGIALILVVSVLRFANRRE